MDESHLCRAGASCSSRSRNTETGEWIPRTTVMPNTICPRCIHAIEAAARHQLWSDYLALHRLFLTPTRHAGSEIRSGEPTSQVPVNVVSDALMNEIADAVYRCASAIAEQLGVTLRETGQLAYWLETVEDNVETLIAAPATDVPMWNRAGDDFAPVRMDGVQLALALVDLHRRAVAMVGVERPRERMPVPCPKCESHQLGRIVTTSMVVIADVDCRACGSVWTDAEYRALTQIGATILREDTTQ